MLDASHWFNFSGRRVLDLGCGEGKNAAYVASLGARVDAIDVSEAALKNARLLWPNLATVNWVCGDVLDCYDPDGSYDVVLAYGVAHCLPREREIELLVARLIASVGHGGLLIFCAFNNRFQQLELAHPGFMPTLLTHKRYIQLFSGIELLTASDLDLEESHPHNNVSHVHSLTRLIGRKS